MTGGMDVDLRIFVVFALNFFVNVFLLLGVSRMVPGKGNYLRTVVAALLGGIYGGSCMVDGFSFLGSLHWRMISMILMTGVAFGINRSSLRRGVLFILLHLALSGATAGVHRGFWSVMTIGCTLALMGVAAFFERPGRYVPVELCYRGQRIRLTALHDTGNTLTDPVTGEAVLVVSADVARKMTGLTSGQLGDPIAAIRAIPGMRLIPYRTIDRPTGMLLAVRVPEAKVGNRRGSLLVAFAPAGLDDKGRYQALTGGAA